jgi:hypothetical protein
MTQSISSRSLSIVELERDRALAETFSPRQTSEIEPYQSAVSMLNFYINRVRKILKTHQHILEHAKDQLREMFGRV